MANAPTSAEDIRRAPLVPVAAAATAGIVLDRYASVPLPVGLIAVAACLAAWIVTRNCQRPGLPLVYLAGAVAALGTAYHHAYREIYPPDDIGRFAPPDLKPVRLRGVLAEEPVTSWQPAGDPLRSLPRSDPTLSVLRASQLWTGNEWLPVSGRARLVVSERLAGLHVGDDVEVVGRWRAPRGPANPGEFDHEVHLRDQRIRAVVVVRKTTDGVTRQAAGWTGSFAGWLALLRGWGQRQLREVIPGEAGGVAGALLLGDGSTMSAREWDKYIQTGVIHVLAISGQHLVVLAVFLWGALRLLGVRRRRGAWLVALLLLGYALLTGGRPPALRAAVMVCAACLGLVLRRPVRAANSFALAWLVVAAVNPTDLFSAGCQLSFLAVAVIFWGTRRWQTTAPDPLRQLIDESRPTWQRALRSIGRTVAVSYAGTLVIWLALAPLVAARYHLVSPAGILLGPPLTVLTSIALISGFLLLLAAAVCAPLAPPFAAVTGWCLYGCERLVQAAGVVPGSHWYVGDIPEWWLWVFYPVLLALLVAPPLQRRWRWIGLAGLTWLCVGLVGCSAKPATDELRCTFLAVGHGGCTVIESEGRTLIYDAGALAGPEVTARQVAPFLWHRGIRRIDEVFLSHADLDHFNGLPPLLDRFAVGQVTLTPSFADKPTPGVRAVMDVLRRRRIPTRVVSAGDRLAAGELDIAVLHPPAAGPEGNENARSLVLLLRHAGHSLLLTGDLEGAGLARVLRLPSLSVDVLMAPHHGSRFANSPELATWARPRLVVSCEGPPRGQDRPPEPYSAGGARFLGTWPHGAITLRSRPGMLIIETFQSRQCVALGDVTATRR